MLNLNDDMDDLIRQAADDYPLKIEGKDWDKVVGAMSSGNNIQPVNNKKYWWLLLLLIPLLTMGVLFMNKNGETQKLVIYSNTKKNNLGTEKQNRNNYDESLNKDNTRAKQETSNSKTAPQQDETTGEAKQNESQLNKQFTTKTPVSISNRNNAFSSKVNSIRKESSGNNGNTSNTKNSNNAILDRSVSEDNSIEKNKPQAASSGLIASEQTNKIGNEKGNPSASIDSSNTNKLALTGQKDSAATIKKKDLLHTTPTKTKGLYIGVAAGLDVTTVKFQEVNKIGYTANFIVGYRINNKWSLESGLMWDNKNYYSSGDYYNPKVPIPPDYNLHYLNGTCEMFEIPLNVKYDFKSRKLNGFFIAAGFSSYLMKKESYIGYVTHFSNPTDPGYDKSFVYKNATNNIFSVGNISGGYQFIFKNNSSLRIEPYLKIPLTGLGVGQMPFLSTGISAAYTLPLH